MKKRGLIGYLTRSIKWKGKAGEERDPSLFPLFKIKGENGPFEICRMGRRGGFIVIGKSFLCIKDAKKRGGEIQNRVSSLD